VCAVCAAGVSVAALPVVSSGRDPKIMAVRAEADAHVSAAARERNFGRMRRLTIDGRPLTRAYLRFDVSEVDPDVRRINLLVYSHTASRIGYQVRLATRRFNERRVTFANAPRASNRFVASGRLRARRWKAVDITSLVGAVPDYVSIVLTTTGPNAIAISSRESGFTGPRLVVEYGPSEMPPPPPPPN
jgi:acid phosphatase type 7